MRGVKKSNSPAKVLLFFDIYNIFVQIVIYLFVFHTICFV